MRCQGILKSGAVVVLALAVGCARDQAVLAENNANLLEAIAQAGLGPQQPVSRAQKPDVTQTAAHANEAERSSDLSATVPTSRIRAIVNGEAILEEEIRAVCFQEWMRANGLPDSERIPRQTEVFNEARENLIDRELIIQEMEHLLGAHKPGQKALEKIREAATQEYKKWVRTVKDSPGIHNSDPAKTNDNFLELLHHMGTTPEMMRRQYERQFMSTEFARHKIFPIISVLASYPYLVQYYESHPEEFMVSDMVDWQDIFIDTSGHPSRDAACRFAEVLADRARSGEDFVKLAEQFDNGICFRNGGNGVGMKRGEIRPHEAESILFQMHDGDVNLVELTTGYHVAKLVKRTYAGKMPFDDKVQKRIKDKLMSEAFGANSNG